MQKLPPDALAHVYDSLNGTDLARVRAVSRTYTSLVDNLTDGNADRRDNKLRRANPDLRRKQDYLHALDAALDFLSRQTNDFMPSHVKITTEDLRVFQIFRQRGRFWLVRPVQTAVEMSTALMRQIRALDPAKVVSMELTEGLYSQQTIYPMVRPGAFPMPDYERFEPSRLTRSGGITSFSFGEGADAVRFHDHQLIPAPNRSTYS